MKKLLIILTLGLMFGAEVSQRTIDVNLEQGLTTNLNELFPNYELDWAIINVVWCGFVPECYLEYENIPNGYSKSGLTHQNSTRYYHSVFNLESDFYVDGNSHDFIISCGEDGIIKLLVTAEFPIEDTGYIEDGFDYCVEPGANLMSYPCDSSVALLDAIPSDALSQFSGIIGQGIAATNLNGTWVGSLTAMQASSGYWIQSNTALCFNYDCSEN